MSDQIATDREVGLPSFDGDAQCFSPARPIRERAAAEVTARPLNQPVGQQAVLGAAPHEGSATAVVHELPATVLDIAIAGAERSTWCRDSRTSNATDHRTHRATDYRAGNDASCRSCALLRRLAGRGSKTNQDCKHELAHGDLLRNHQGTASELNGFTHHEFSTPYGATRLSECCFPEHDLCSVARGAQA